MIKKQITLFLLRWLVSSTAMWVCITWFGHITEGTETVWLYVTAGLIFSLVNTVVKPILTILSLPFIILTMGIFVLILNAAMVGLTIWLLPHVTMTFGSAVLSSIVISVINLLVNLLVPAYNKK
jgi:putative membrane protein